VNAFDGTLILYFFDWIAGGKNDVKGSSFDKEVLLDSGKFLSGLESSTYKINFKYLFIIININIIINNNLQYNLPILIT